MTDLIHHLSAAHPYGMIAVLSVLLAGLIYAYYRNKRIYKRIQKGRKGEKPCK